MALDMISTPRSSRNPLNAVNPVAVFRDPRVSSTLSTGSRSSRVPSGSQPVGDLPGELGEHHRFGDLRVLRQRRPRHVPDLRVHPGGQALHGGHHGADLLGTDRRRRPPRPAAPGTPVGFPHRRAGPGAGSPGRRGPARRHRPGRCTTVAAATPRWTPRRCAWNTRRVSTSPVRWTCAAYTNRPTRSKVSARVSRSSSPIFQNSAPRNASTPAHTDPATAVACSMSLISSMNRTLDHTTDSPRKPTIRPAAMPAGCRPWNADPLPVGSRGSAVAGAGDHVHQRLGAQRLGEDRRSQRTAIRTPRSASASAAYPGARVHPMPGSRLHCHIAAL